MWGLVSIIGVTPLLGFAVRLLPITPAEYVAGLTIFCRVPSTLGIGISLATSAKESWGQGSARGGHGRVGGWLVCVHVAGCWPGVSSWSRIPGVCGLNHVRIHYTILHYIA